MPLEKLSRQQLKQERSASANPEYVAFLSSLKPGEGGRTTEHEEGVSRQTIKTRLKRAAQELGVGIRFHRSSADDVVFEIESA
jgi:hypothetical protein